MSAIINLQDLSIANFDQLLDVDGIQGGRRSYSKKSYSFSYSKPSYSRKSRSSVYRKRR